jgi:hypothetical protein
MDFGQLIHSEEFQQLITGRQFLLDNYLEGAKKKAKKGVGRTDLEIPIGEARYLDYLPLNELWKEYISDLLGGNYSEKSIANKILKADLHGAAICVWRSSVKTYEGQKGIVLHETMKTFRVVTKEDKVKSKK